MHRDQFFFCSFLFWGCTICFLVWFQHQLPANLWRLCLWEMSLEKEMSIIECATYCLVILTSLGNILFTFLNFRLLTVGGDLSLHCRLKRRFWNLWKTDWVGINLKNYMEILSHRIAKLLNSLKHAGNFLFSFIQILTQEWELNNFRRPSSLTPLASL